MISLKPIRYLIFAALMLTIPVYPKGLFSHCADAFQATKQSVVDVANGQASTKTTIGVGLTALIIVYALIKYAIYKRDASFFKARGINIDYPDRFTAHLKIAVENNDVPLISMLLKYGASIHDRDHYYDPVKSEKTPLEIAIEKNEILIEFLLKRTKNINKKSLEIALLFAIRKSWLNDTGNKSIKLLLNQDKRIAPEVNGITLAHAAYWNSAVLDFLIEHENATGKFNKKHLNDALFVSIWGLNRPYLKHVGEILRYGADINTKRLIVNSKDDVPRYKQIETPLAHAILVGDPYIVKLLIKKGAQIEIEKEVSAYDYVEDMGKYSDYHKSKERIYAILDNHRRELASRYRPEVHQAVHSHLTKDTTGIVMQYVDPIYYPLMDKRPLKSFEPVNDGC